MNIQEIKAAVDAGKSVKWVNDGYNVIKDSIGQYLIVFEGNKSAICLTGREGTPYENVLNGKEHEFYIK